MRFRRVAYDAQGGLVEAHPSSQSRTSRHGPQHSAWHLAYSIRTGARYPAPFGAGTGAWTVSPRSCSSRIKNSTVVSGSAPRPRCVDCGKALSKSLAPARIDGRAAPKNRDRPSQLLLSGAEHKMAKKHRKLGNRIESLESRAMMAGDVVNAFVQQGTLYIYGTQQNDNIAVHVSDKKVEIPGVMIKNAQGQLVSSLSREEVPYQVIATGQAGDDYIAIIEEGGKPLPVVFYGNQGNDTLIGGSSDDALIGQDGFDTLIGNAGNDKLIAALYADEHDLPQSSDWIETLDGGAGDDILFGSAGADWLYGDAGHDKLFGLAGDDVLAGGDGIDDYDGGAGIDKLIEVGITGTAGLRDTSYSEGGSGVNEFGYFTRRSITVPITGIEKAELTADDANSTEVEIDASDFSGDVVLRGTAGPDTLIGGSGNDTLFGYAGADTLIGNGGKDLLDGGTGVNTLDAGPGESTIDPFTEYLANVPATVTAGLGAAVSGPQNVGDGVGRYQQFADGVLIWSPSTNVHAVYGAIYTKWKASGGTATEGYPTADAVAFGTQYLVPAANNNTTNSNLPVPTMSDRLNRQGPNPDVFQQHLNDLKRTPPRIQMDSFYQTSQEFERATIVVAPLRDSVYDVPEELALRRGLKSEQGTF